VLDVPLHPVRQRERGYNQAALLADSLALRLGSPRLPDCSMTAREAVPQTPPRPAAAPLQMKDFDSALLDRLTDDVIRRMARRARIERERRGL